MAIGSIRLTDGLAPFDPRLAHHAMTDSARLISFFTITVFDRKVFP
jgi:hypothetical protein